MHIVYTQAGETSLHCACDCRNVEVINTLLRNRANISAPNIVSV